MDSFPPLSERRRHPRVPVMAQVRIRGAVSDIVMDVTNVSLSGALVDMGALERPAWVKPGRKIEMTMVLPESDESAELVGTIVRVLEDLQGTRFAVRFSDATDAARAFLGDVVVESRRMQPPPLPTR